MLLVNKNKRAASVFKFVSNTKLKNTELEI